MTTSQINPNNINPEYPVAGQDNNTQGFRDNFNNIRVNFQYAENEINTLLANSISKVSTSVNEFNDSVIYGARLQNTGYMQVNRGNVAPTAAINYAAGSYQTITVNAATTLNFTNLPAAGNTAVITLAINAVAANTTADPYTLTVANVNNSSSGIIGYSGGVLSFPRTNTTSAGTHTYQFVTDDNGSSFTVTPLATLAAPLNASSEDVANVGVINLGVSDSYFSTTAAETATLPAGINGQVKVLALYADTDDSSLDNMVITVTNAGWKTSGTGTITFDTIGDACTLKYINSKWFCIGNNGCTFA
jgi:hypothetical protein